MNERERIDVLKWVYTTGALALVQIFPTNDMFKTHS